jgi:hypothetical protein
MTLIKYIISFYKINKNNDTLFNILEYIINANFLVSWTGVGFS